MALGIGGKAIAGLADRAAIPDAGQHILQWAPLWDVIEHVIGRDERQASRCAESSKTGKALHIIAAIEMVRGEIGAVAEIRRDPGCKLHRNIRRLGWQHHDDLTFPMCNDIGVAPALRADRALRDFK
jgi:hypothetical protein